LQDHRGNLQLLDSQSRDSHTILSVAPNSLGGAALSRDNRLIYMSVVVFEADIWLATLD
jgi:hypothetical protein